MFVPPRGFRHAAILLLTGAARAIPPGASPEAVAGALARLARDFAELADDMRAAPESAAWMMAEYARAVRQLPHDVDRAKAISIAAPILARVSDRATSIEPRDLFVVYLAEDRLPVAAPLAVELMKRRVSVAFSDYEVATEDQLSAALQHGLRHHRSGVVLYTGAFARAGWQLRLPDIERVRVIRQFGPPAADELAAWARR